MSVRSFCLCLPFILFCDCAQAQDKKVKSSLKLDALNFRNQVVRLKEYKAELKKAGQLGITYGAPVKIVIDIDADTTAEEDDITDPADNIITGYIKEETPTESIVSYELHFDRTTKKIVDIHSELDPVEPKTNKKEDE